MLPKISIITASYNSADTIEQTISSVLAQRYVDIEHVVIDGGSTDGTIDILEKYKDGRLKWISEPDHGITDAFCKGLSLAEGEYIVFLGADDALVDQNILSKISKYLENDVDILCGARFTVDEISIRQYIYKIPIKYRKINNYNGMMTATEGMFIKKELLLHKYPLDRKYKICMDYKFFLQAFYDGNIKIKFIEEPITFFSNGGLSNKKVDQGMLEMNLIYSELGLSFHCQSDNDINVKSLKSIIKYGLKKVGLLEKSRYIYKFILQGERHHCNNPFCRWCGRG